MDGIKKKKKKKEFGLPLHKHEKHIIKRQQELQRVNGHNEEKASPSPGDKL